MTNYSNTKIYGKNPEEGIVAIELRGGDNTNKEQSFVDIYSRYDGYLIKNEDIFFPFIYLSDPSLLYGFKRNLYKIKKLAGENYYNNLIVFNTWHDMWKAVYQIKENAFERGLTDTPSDYPIELYMIKTPAEQYLTQSGKTLFKGMEFNDIVRLRLDIETYSSREGFPNAERPEDYIMIVTLATNRGYKRTLYISQESINIYEVPNGTACKDEKDLLETLVEIINDINPDTVEGHNIFAFDLPYIKTRCELLGVPFTIGREGKIPEIYQASKKFAERQINYTVFNIYGRHVIDTYFEAMNFDVFSRDLPGYGLKVVAKYFGFAPEGRTYVDGDKISWYWDNNPMELLRYAEDDTTECSRLSEHLGGSSFFLTQILPMNYQKTALSGTARKIESLFVRQYLLERHSLPARESARQEVGGYTDIFKTGIYDRIVYADVESLYPSIMLNYNAHPHGEDLHFFEESLKELTNLRFAAKAEMKKYKEVGDKENENKYQALQTSYKTLINSYYGMMGFSGAIFNDYSEADRVTVIGQQLLRQMINLVVDDGGSVIESDTDGILMQAPSFVYTKDDTEDKERAVNFVNSYNNDSKERPPLIITDDESYVKSLTERMPSGIDIGFDGRAVTMISYKKKNYALREPGKKRIKIKGNSLISRKYEKFGVMFIEECIEHLMNRDVAAVTKTYRKYYNKIINHDWDIEEFAKRATLKDSIETYKRKVTAGSGKGGRNKDAAYELAISRAEQTGIKPEPGDRISYYVAGDSKAYKVRAFEDSKHSNEWDKNNPNENTNWYIKRLKTFAEKFEKFFTEEDFNIIFSDKEITEQELSTIQIQNKEVHRIGMPVVIVGPENMNNIFWVDRAVAGAKFLKTLDTDDHGISISHVITTDKDIIIQEWAEENRLPLEILTSNKKLGAAAPIELAERLLMTFLPEGTNEVESLIKVTAAITIHDGPTPVADAVALKANNLGLNHHISHIV